MFLRTYIYMESKKVNHGKYITYIFWIIKCLEDWFTSWLGIWVMGNDLISNWCDEWLNYNIADWTSYSINHKSFIRLVTWSYCGGNTFLSNFHLANINILTQDCFCIKGRYLEPHQPNVHSPSKYTTVVGIWVTQCGHNSPEKVTWRIQINDSKVKPWCRVNWKLL